MIKITANVNSPHTVGAHRETGVGKSSRIHGIVLEGEYIGQTESRSRIRNSLFSHFKKTNIPCEGETSLHQHLW